MSQDSQIRTEPSAEYRVGVPTGRRAEDAVIAEALEILRNRLAVPGALLESPEAVRQYLRLALAAETSEVFGVVLLDTRHRVRAIEKIFQGSIDSATIYPREVVKIALQHNAAACVLFHNHPSGDTDPSQDDVKITGRLKEALALIDVRVLDHFIVGGSAELAITSMREQGKI